MHDTNSFKWDTWCNDVLVNLIPKITEKWRIDPNFFYLGRGVAIPHVGFRTNLFRKYIASPIAFACHLLNSIKRNTIEFASLRNSPKRAARRKIVHLISASPSLHWSSAFRSEFLYLLSSWNLILLYQVAVTNMTNTWRNTVKHELSQFS